MSVADHNGRGAEGTRDPGWSGAAPRLGTCSRKVLAAWQEGEEAGCRLHKNRSSLEPACVSFCSIVQRMEGPKGKCQRLPPACQC